MEETSVEPTFDELKIFFNKSINIVFWKDAKIAYRFHKKTYGNTVVWPGEFNDYQRQEIIIY